MKDISSFISGRFSSPPSPHRLDFTLSLFLPRALKLLLLLVIAPRPPSQDDPRFRRGRGRRGEHPDDPELDDPEFHRPSKAELEKRVSRRSVKSRVAVPLLGAWAWALDSFWNLGVKAWGFEEAVALAALIKHLTSVPLKILC